ncbi:MAG: 3'(2'),5'-bisphosphate nucleotidase CysQ [Bacteroidaceae bacterium]|nr:3'(2'),5'-bisphosphate nucleotidase CysQ [Bacteroidaceae bacterium]
MENLLKIAIVAAHEAAEEIMRVYQDPRQNFDIEEKSDKSPLTRADRAAHKCIVRHLSQTGIPILSEEGAHLPYEERKEWHRLWVVDPLDGTKEFIKKNGEFTVNIALVEDGSPVLGVILVPVTGMIYFGIVGMGAWKTTSSSLGKGNEVLHLDGDAEREDVYTIVASRSHLNPETEQYISQMRNLHKAVKLISSGSSLKICLVAEGKADVYPRFAPTMEWDTAAGDAIIRASGKQIVNAETGQPLIYNKPDLHNPWFIVR